MAYRDAMELCKNHISRHSGDVVTARELADMTGYSLYHFCHVFRAYFDVSVGEYIRRVALNAAADAILDGKPIMEAALDAGFSTPAGFSKAFKRQFGMSATEYRRQNLKRSEKTMEFAIERKSAFAAIGYYIAPAGESVDVLESGAYWFGADFSSQPEYPTDSSANGEIGMWTHPSETDGALKYFFGYVSGGAAPEGFAKVDIPEAEYAVFEVPAAKTFTNGGEELANNIRSTWKYVFKEWLDASAYAFDEAKVCFEFYHGAITKIFVPVKAKN